MENIYRSVTDATIAAISAIAESSISSEVSAEVSARLLACSLYSAWRDLAGEIALKEDVYEIEALIRSISSSH